MAFTTRFDLFEMVYIMKNWVLHTRTDPNRNVRFLKQFLNSFLVNIRLCFWDDFIGQGILEADQVITF